MNKEAIISKFIVKKCPICKVSALLKILALEAIVIGLYTHLQAMHVRAVIPDLAGIILLTIGYTIKNTHKCRK